LKLLIKHGGDVNIKNAAGTPAFFRLLGSMKTIRNDADTKDAYMKLAKLVKKSGIDVTLKNAGGRTFDYLAVKKDGKEKCIIS
jgi:hypothetical protein